MKIPIDFLTPGMRVQKPLFGRRGELLLNRGVTLSDSLITLLKKNNILTVDVEGPVPFDEYQIKDTISEKLRQAALNTLMDWIKNRHILNLNRVYEVVKSLVEEILSDKEVSDNLTNLCSTDLYTFAHSVDVCILSVMAGKKLGFNKKKLYTLGMGSILHDVGKLDIPPEILNKPARLSPQEYEIIKKHPIYSYEKLRKREDENLNQYSLNIVLNHHERFDGSGYPRRLKKDEIYELDYLCAIADVFNAMTTHRVYRKALPVHEVYEMLEGSCDTLFPYDITKAFLSCIAPFPPGTLVMLSSDEPALVIASSTLPFRPMVKLLRSSEDIDLTKELNITIKRQLTPEEALSFIPTIDRKRFYSLINVNL
ncbi:HD-GYP domain-containing protein [Thermovenabulum gondwanense]|uniref:Cyclic di-GMP phosphodiesterase response regulator RpfG n=1 Tax=Thermovenabulum gondwanense TaxID=520767 RepID=A0A161PXB4_9FIRM|nr:HD-GYP domain-containing protein [Thermovenabulum gondwanense]KYO66484.1 Cyclic di-GMP phosphodiesterase response regulator RpfG [Thermovenabulum gondwanense]